MEDGYLKKDEDVHPQLLDLIQYVKKDDHKHEGSRTNGDEKKLELRLGPPGVEDWSLSDAHKNHKSPQKTAPAPVVGWPPIRSCRKNISKPAPVKNEKLVQKGLFVKINMIGVPIGRKVDLSAYDSYEKLSVAVDQLFRGLLAAQIDPSGGGVDGDHEHEKAIKDLLYGNGEYTLVYEDDEGDKMLVGDVPWNMFVSSVKRLRVIKSCEISNICLGSREEKIKL